ncbi:hypothetical protein [Mycoplasma zalophidermidis]|nr:hypothetical protein [Mycoplasma zalophidermidis]MCR8966440.1 hypothetical protein [Mycoplasma zalophidermidis]
MKYYNYKLKFKIQNASLKYKEKIVNNTHNLWSKVKPAKDGVFT